MSIEKREINLVSSSDEETSVRAFVPSAEVLNCIVEELGTVFRQNAPKLNIRVLRGSKGSHPNSIHVVEMLVRVWDTLAIDKEWKDRILSDYADDYIEIIDVSDTELIRISQIRKEHVNRLVKIKCYTMGMTPNTPRILVAAYECKRCGHHNYIVQEHDRLIEPFEFMSRCINR